MGKEILTFGNIEIEKKINFTTIRLQFFFFGGVGGGGWEGWGGDVDIVKALVFNKISFGEKNYKYFIGYLYDGYTIKYNAS